MTDHTASGMPAAPLAALRKAVEAGAPCPLDMADKCVGAGCWLWRHLDGAWEMCKARKEREP